jgi:hypothetical protein
MIPNTIIPNAEIPKNQNPQNIILKKIKQFFKRHSFRSLRGNLFEAHKSMTEYFMGHRTQYNRSPK